jgi:hypothetical protein
MEFAGYILWGDICFFVSLALLVFVVLVRFYHWSLFFGYVAAAILIFTTICALEGFYVAWSTLHDSWREANHIFVSDNSTEQLLRFRYPVVALPPLLALVLLHFGPRRRRDSEPMPPPNS